MLILEYYYTCSPPLPGGVLNRGGVLITNFCLERMRLFEGGAVNRIIAVRVFYKKPVYKQPITRQPEIRKLLELQGER